MARVSDFIFTKNPNLKKIAGRGVCEGEGARVRKFFLTKNANLKFFLSAGGGGGGGGLSK